MPEPWLAPSSIGKRVPKVDQRKDLHYLVPPFGEPIALDSAASHVTVLGRDEDCGVQIKSPTVSRRHAEIAFKGDPPRAHVRDLGGTNGTRVNGEVLSGERALDDRDVLKLGDITAVYRVVGAKDRGRIEQEAAPGSLDATMRIGGEALEKGSRLVADVNLVSIQNVFGRLTLLRASGVFTVEVDGSAGHVRFEEGRVKEARFGDRTGDVAVRTIASLTRGRCRFEAK
jgi:pSer/pThr/pTyr-binding forkhead associated (FHA) protein